MPTNSRSLALGVCNIGARLGSGWSPYAAVGGLWFEIIGVRRGVSKWVEEGRRPPALATAQVAHLQGVEGSGSQALAIL
jgi:hypothetical protein